MGKVWDLVEQHRRDTPYGPTPRSIAVHAGLKPSTFYKWQNLSRLPAPGHLRAIARQINVPYRVLLDAALTDTGYLGGPDEQADQAPTNHAGGSPAKPQGAIDLDPGVTTNEAPSTQPREDQESN